MVDDDAPIHILIVDDEPDLRLLLQNLLLGAGYAVLAAGDADSALHVLAGHPIDLILLDLIMPGMDGPRLGKRIKHMHSHVPIIILSCITRPETKAEAMRLYAEDYVTKPFSPEELLARIEHVLRRTGRLDGLPPAVPVADTTLTERQRQILRLLAQGLTDQEIALRLKITVHTVKFHCASIYLRLGVRNRAEAIATAHYRGLLGDGAD